MAAGVPLVERMDYLSAQSNSMAFCLSVGSCWASSPRARAQYPGPPRRAAAHQLATWSGSARTAWSRRRVGDALLLPTGTAAQHQRAARRFPAVSELHARRRPARGSAARRARRSSPFSIVSGRSWTSTRTCSRRRIYLKRTQNVGVISKDKAVARAARSDRSRGRRRVTSAMLSVRGYDMRLCRPTQTRGRISRYLVRVAEMRESEDLPAGAQASPTGFSRSTTRGSSAAQGSRVQDGSADSAFLIYSQGFTVPAGEAACRSRTARRAGFYVVSDSTNQPWRIKSRPPSLLACQALDRWSSAG